MVKHTTIYLVRHGESELNKQSKLAGHIDSPLSATGVQQVRQTKKDLANVMFDVVYSSDLKRTVQTAEIVSGKAVPAGHRLQDLRERTYGELEGETKAALAASEAAKERLSEAEKWTFRNVSGMETDEELAARFLEALRRIVFANRGKTILVAAHGGPIRMALMKIAGFSHADWPRGSFKNGGYAALKYDDKGFKVVRIGGIKL
jgi:2,3-bisphosphoglycerate-dependent phosphoglycerate mutase